MLEPGPRAICTCHPWVPALASLDELVPHEGLLTPVELEDVALLGRLCWATVGSWNTPSLRVAQKLGFQRHHSTTEADREVVWTVCDR